VFKSEFYQDLSQTLQQVLGGKKLKADPKNTPSFIFSIY